MSMKSLGHDLSAWKAAREQLREMENALGFAILRHIKEGGPYPMGMADEVAAKRREVDKLARVALGHKNKDGL